MADFTQQISSTWKAMRKMAAAPHQACIVTRWLEVMVSSSTAERVPMVTQVTDIAWNRRWSSREQPGWQQL